MTEKFNPSYLFILQSLILFAFQVYKVHPCYVSEGSTMPAVSIFNKMCPASNIIVMPIRYFYL